MFTNNWEFWLNVTNIALGVATILAVLIFGYAVVSELALRHKKSRTAEGLEVDAAHTMTLPELGLTMADGGEKVKSASKGPERQKKSS